MIITVVGGTGYVGLTTAVCLAMKGHLVYCVGRNREKVEKTARGFPTLYEEGLEDMLNDALKRDKLIATTDLKKAINNSDVSFICVGTPSKSDGSIDLTQIGNAVEALGRVLVQNKSYHVVTVKSTVMPGTTEKVVIPILEKFSGKKVGRSLGVCMNPEFLREGRAIEDFLYPKDLGIVIGEFDEKSGDVLLQIYKEFDARILRTNIRTAEMIKYARNCYLAKDISFANEIANTCQQLGIDFLAVKDGMEMDARIGKGRFLNAGVGFGGSCFPKDVQALIARAREIGITPRMMEATLEVNEGQPLKMIELIKQFFTELAGKKIAVLGLAFKPGTDDMRCAPSIKIISALLSDEAHVYVYDPKALDNAEKIFGNKIIYCRTAEEALHNADACLIVTEWPEFTDPKLYSRMRCRIIIDGRRMLNPSTLSSGFTYHAIGFPGPVKT